MDELKKRAGKQLRCEGIKRDGIRSNYWAQRFISGRNLKDNRFRR